MARRLELQSVLGALCGNVYFQPPASLQMVYPCIVYGRYIGLASFANDKPYRYTECYQITVIDRDPDSALLAPVAALPMCRKNRSFVANNLNHDVYVLYF